MKNSELAYLRRHTESSARILMLAKDKIECDLERMGDNSDFIEKVAQLKYDLSTVNEWIREVEEVFDQLREDEANEDRKN